MDLGEAISEFSSLLEVAGRSLLEIIKSEDRAQVADYAHVCANEVVQIAERLREIGEELGKLGVEL